MSDAGTRDSDRRENRKRELISQEAAEWFARMKDPHVPLDDRQRFLRWLKQSRFTSPNTCGSRVSTVTCAGRS